MDFFDVVVVGCGPCGGYAGKRIAEGDASVLMLEEHNEIGKPMQCAGLVSTRVCELVDTGGLVMAETRKGKVHSPAGQVIELESKKSRGLVIDRAGFDRKLASDAVRAGCCLRLGAKFLNVERFKDEDLRITYLASGEKTYVKTSLLIGADGPSSAVARLSGLPPCGEMVAGFGGEGIWNGGQEGKNDTIHIFTGDALAPGFFAWVIPTGGDRVRAGLCTSPGDTCASEHFKRLKGHPASRDVFSNIKFHTTMTGVIPIGTRARDYSDSVMVVGDAAGQTKPLSGGGIFTGLTCAGICADVALEALEAKNTSSRFLSAYHSRWNAKLGKELKRAARLRKLLLELTPKQIEDGFRILNDEKLISLLVNKGDIDYPTLSAIALVKKAPALVKVAGAAAIKSLFS